MEGGKYGILLSENSESGGIMRKLLIAMDDNVLCGALVDLLRRSYDVTVCSDGGTAVRLVRSLNPHVLILELMLPVKDGLCVMEETEDHRPPVVLCVSDFSNNYISQTAQELGITFMVRKPCQPRAIVSRLEHLVNYTPLPGHFESQAKTAQILLSFRFNPKNDGFRFLKVGIPLYAQDPQQRVCKELYASIAQICGAGSWNQVERSIRSAIDGAWQSGADVWGLYFPGAHNPPTGKTFISRLAQTLIDDTDIH